MHDKGNLPNELKLMFFYNVCYALQKLGNSKMVVSLLLSPFNKNGRK